MNLSNGTTQPETVAVVSLLLRRPDGHILLGVRRPVATSRRHPGVLSTLTMRVPLEIVSNLLPTLAGEEEVELDKGTVIVLPANAHASIGQPCSSATSVGFLAECVLTKKLGLGDKLLESQVTGHAVPIGLAIDDVSDPKGGGSLETTLMLTIEVALEDGLETLPRSSACYSELVWVGPQELVAALASNDALLAIPHADPFQVCIHGLCVRSAAELVSSRNA